MQIVRLCGRMDYACTDVAPRQPLQWPNDPQMLWRSTLALDTTNQDGLRVLRLVRAAQIVDFNNIMNLIQIGCSTSIKLPTACHSHSFHATFSGLAALRGRQNRLCRQPLSIAAASMMDFAADERLGIHKEGLITERVQSMLKPAYKCLYIYIFYMFCKQKQR